MEQFLAQLNEDRIKSVINERFVSRQYFKKRVQKILQEQKGSAILITGNTIPPNSIFAIYDLKLLTSSLTDSRVNLSNFLILLLLPQQHLPQQHIRIPMNTAPISKATNMIKIVSPTDIFKRKSV
jgi:hypothetical protein